MYVCMYHNDALLSRQREDNSISQVKRHCNVAGEVIQATLSVYFQIRCGLALPILNSL